jgi:hypothetical protein
MDQKLFLKTGKPFLRQCDVNDQKVDAVLSWTALTPFSVLEKEKQFSFWLEEIEKGPLLRNTLFRIETPFFNDEGHYIDLCRKEMKHRYAEWSVVRD